MSKQLLLLEVTCPNCGDELTDGSKVKLTAFIKEPRQEGEIRLSAIFGEYTVETDLDIQPGTTVDFRCPSCDQSIMLATACKMCGAPMASLNLKDGGYVEFCARRGCTGHTLGGSGDIDAMIGLINRMMNTPHD